MPRRNHPPKRKSRKPRPVPKDVERKDALEALRTDLRPPRPERDRTK